MRKRSFAVMAANNSFAVAKLDTAISGGRTNTCEGDGVGRNARVMVDLAEGHLTSVEILGMGEG